MLRVLLIVTVVTMFTLVPTIYTQVPPTLSYQGMLTGSDDHPVEDGIYEMHFNLYGEADPSTPLWSESQSVTAVQGIFNAILGAVNPLELPFDEQYYLGIAVGEGPELSPRVALTSSAYSFRARSVDDGQVVKSINELRDDIMLEAGENVSITEDENKIIISAATTGGVGNITQITAGEGLTGGGTEGEVTLAIDEEGITSEKLANAAVTTAKISDNAVTGSKIANNQVVRSINDLTDAVYIAAEGGATITTREDTLFINAGSGGDGSGIQGIQNTNNTLDILNPSGPTTTINIKNGGIGTQQIENGAVTQEKIHSDVSLPISGIAGGDLTGTYPDPEINEYAVTSDKIADGAITTDKIAANIDIITSGNIQARSVYGKAYDPNFIHYGVHGEAQGTSGRGVFGHANNPAGATYGVYGLSESAFGTGVYGQSTTFRGVWGAVTHPEGYAGYFTGGRNYFGGKVGIGTNNPQAKVEILHQSSFTEPHISLLESTELGYAQINLGNEMSTERSWYIRGRTTASEIAPAEFVIQYKDGNQIYPRLLMRENTTTVGARVDELVGIGLVNPSEKLHVSGAIRIGNTNREGSGTIRWTGEDFEGRKGSEWVSLTSQGNSIWNQSGDAIYYSGGGVSIGTNASRALLTLRGPDDATDGPTMLLFGNVSDQFESGRIRFVEGTANANWRGAYIHFDGDANKFHLGVHNTSDNDRSNDVNAITITRTSTPRVGIGTDSPSSAFLLSVNGDAAKPGGGSWSVFSDKRLKRNIVPIDRGILDELLTLRGYTFEYLDDVIENGFALPGRQTGLIAQEVLEVYPGWVDSDAEGYLYVTERGTTALFIEALRELRVEKDTEIRELQQDIDRLQEHIGYLESLVTRIVAEY